MTKMTHGESHWCGHRTPEYTAWVNMIARCENPSASMFHIYGGRGISVCRRWRTSFESFLADVGRRTSPKHSLDRFPNQSGDYEPTNVRWATSTQQNRNRRDNVLVVVGSETLTVTEWAERTGLNTKTICTRIAKGVLGSAVVAPARTRHLFGGERLLVSEIARRVGIPVATLIRRMNRHGTIEVAVREYHKNGRGKNKRSQRQKQRTT